MQKKIESYMEQHHMVSPGDKVIVGVSGGADSMCLLCVLKNYQEKIPFQIIAVHVNHMLRGAAADADEAFVEIYCKEMGITYECFRVPVDKLAKEQKLTTEEAGRIARRDALMKVSEQYGGTKIALAHHMNDNAETFMLNLARGSALDGLSGIRPVNGMYIRPLLCIKREDVEKYLQEQNVSFCIDETNQEDAYTRNRIRNHVIPYLQKEVNAKTVEHIAASVEELREVREYLELQTHILVEKYVREENGILILEALEKEMSMMQRRVIRAAIVKSAEKEKDIESKHVEMIRNLSKKQVGRQVDLPYGIKAIRVYEGILLKKDVAAQELPDKIEIHELKKGERIEVSYGEWIVEMQVFPRDGAEMDVPKKTFTKWFDYDIIKGTVSIRGRESGDRLVIDESGKTQKLKNFFINEKIPADKRAYIPLIADATQIMWVVGYRQSQAYQVTEHTKNILQITIRNL